MTESTNGSAKPLLSMRTNACKAALSCPGLSLHLIAFIALGLYAIWLGVLVVLNSHSDGGAHRLFIERTQTEIADFVSESRNNSKSIEQNLISVFTAVPWIWSTAALTVSDTAALFQEIFWWYQICGGVVLFGALSTIVQLVLQGKAQLQQYQLIFTAALYACQGVDFLLHGLGLAYMDVQSDGYPRILSMYVTPPLKKLVILALFSEYVTHQSAYCRSALWAATLSASGAILVFFVPGSSTFVFVIRSIVFYALVFSVLHFERRCVKLAKQDAPEDVHHLLQSIDKLFILYTVRVFCHFAFDVCPY